MNEEKIFSGEPTDAAAGPAATAVAPDHAAAPIKINRRPSLALKILKRTLIGAGALVLLVEVVLGVLYWLYPNQVVESWRYYYNPYEKAEVVTSEKPPDASAPLDKSQLVDVDLPFTEKVKRRAIVYLPKGYQTGVKDLRYPVVYLLHGSPGTEIDWLQKGKAQAVLDEAIEKHVVPPVIAVFPNGHALREDSEFINSADGKEPNEDFIVKTVVSYVDATYPTYADSKFRAIGGLSEGGFGALNLGLKNQDVFGYTFGIAGYAAVDKNAKTVQGSAQVIHDNTPLVYVPESKRHSTKVLLFCGLQDKWFLQQNQDLDKVLKAQKYAVEFRTAPGAHNWGFFTAGLKEGLAWWGKGMAADLTWDGAPSGTEAPKAGP